MKIKIVFISIVGIIALVVSSFQSIENKQDYNPIAKNTNNYDLKEHKLYFSQAVVSCAKCHNCQRDNPINQDSITTTIKTYFQKVKTNSNATQKTEKAKINQEKVDCNTDENPDNFKIK